MKTVKEGRKQGGWTKKFKCSGKGNGGGGCGEKLLVFQTDLYQTNQQSVGDSSPEYFITFCCHKCGVETDVEGVVAKPLGKRPTEKQREEIIRKVAKAMRANPRHSQRNKKIRVVLGSTSPHKLDAVRKACERLGMEASIFGVKTSSGQNAQPIGFEETFAGALTRAMSASRAPYSDAIAVGIESGIFHFCRQNQKVVSFDIAVIVLITMDNRQIVTTSAGIVFPEECVKKAETQGFESTTVGAVIAKFFGSDPADPHSILTKGRVSRKTILTDALVVAFGQI